MRLSLVAALLLAAPAAADELPREAFAPHLDFVLRDPALTTFYGRCPADIFASRRFFFSTYTAELDPDACAADLERCVDTCRYGGKPETCLSAALTFEAAEDAIGSEPGRRLFALACVVGSASGCTNRGAGIRNAPLDGDPLVGMPIEARENCLARTFALSCAKDDAWGCAMSGQALELGEGIAADPRAAVAAYDKACALSDDPEFGACVFARDRRDAVVPR